MDATLPSWLTLDQAAKWLTDKTQSVDIHWTEESLLGTLVSSIGPFKDICGCMPVWLSANATLSIAASGEDRQISKLGDLVCLSHETLKRFYLHRELDSGRVAISGSEDTRGQEHFLKPGIVIPRTWLVVQGFDLIRFLMAYATTMKKVQSVLDPSVKANVVSAVQPESSSLVAASTPSAGAERKANAKKSPPDDLDLAMRELMKKLNDAALKNGKEKFNWRSMPGIKADLWSVIKTVNGVCETFCGRSKATWDDYLPNWMTFMRGSKSSDIYKILLQTTYTSGNTGMAVMRAVAGGFTTDAASSGSSTKK